LNQIIIDPHNRTDQTSATKKAAFGTPIGFFDFFRQFKTGIPREQLIRLAEQTPNNTAVTFTIILLTVFLLYSHVPLHWLLLWAGIQSALQTLVIMRWRASQKKYKEPQKLDMRYSVKGLRQAFVWALLSGLMWGSLTLFLPLVPPFQLLGLVMIMAGMASGASSTMAAIPQISSIFILCCTTPAFFYFLSHEDPDYKIIAGMAFIFTGSMLGTGRVVYKSLLQQILAERRSEEFRAAHFQDKIASIVNEELDMEIALKKCLEEVCDYLGWPLGHIYMPQDEDDNDIFISRIHYGSNPDLLDRFERATHNFSPEYDAGLTGQVKKTHRPVWMKDISEDESLLSQYLRDTMGIHSAFAFPVMIKGNIVAILEFFSPKLTKADQDLLEFMGPTGIQIGRAIERRQSEKALQESAARMKTLIDNSVQGILIHRNGKALFLNEQFSRIYGYTMEEVMELDSIAELIHPDDVERLMRYMWARYEGRKDVPEAYECRCIHRDGHTVPIFTRAAAINWEGKKATISTFFDLSELKDVEANLIKNEQELQRRVDELEKAEEGLKQQEVNLLDLNYNLTLARDNAHAASRAKSEFLASMSHELRTPLNAIIGFSEMIKNEVFGPVNNEKYMDYITDILGSGRHLLSIVNDILDLAKVESGTEALVREAFDFKILGQDVLDMLKQQALEKKISLYLDIPEDLPPLKADKRKVKQILINLLTNAIKFNKPDGQVTLSALKEENDFIFRVNDTGIGMEESLIPKALSRFGQVESDLNRKYEGTGLGLPLTVALVKLHGGELELNSVLGTGTTVTISLPDEKKNTPDEI